MSTQAIDRDAPVVVRFAALGDVVLLTVLLQALHERHGRRVALLSSGAWTPVLLAHDPAVGAVQMVSSRRAPYWLTPTQWAAVRWLRAHRGPVYLCDPDPAAARLVARAVPPERIVPAWAHRPAGPIHWADWWLRIAALDPPAGPFPDAAIRTPAQPRLHLPPAWLDDTRQWLAAQGLAGRPLVLLQPGHKKTHKRGRVGTAYHDKHWPTPRWAAVAHGVAQALPGAAVLVCGSPPEAGLVQAIVDAARPVPPGACIVNAATLGLPLPRLVALAALAHSMVSVDTGPAHVAAAMDCPLVVLYGAAGWALWLPRAPSGRVVPLGAREPTPGARLEDLQAEQVLAAWRTLPGRFL
jgi:heptosyltransferase III